MTIDFRRLAAAGLQPIPDDHPPVDHWRRRLCQAILADAVGCLEGKRSLGGWVPRGAVARHTLEAWEWVLSDADYCFSFITVCAVLQLNAQAVRRAVSHHFAQGSAQPGGRSRLPRHRAARRVRRDHTIRLTPMAGGGKE